MASKRWITTGSITGAAWSFENSNRVAMFPDQAKQILRPENDGSRVVVGMDADQPGILQKRFIEEELRLSVRIVEQTERADSSSRQM